MIVAVAMSEPDAGSALTDLKTKGRVTNDKVILNGLKRWCSGGGHADGYVVYCRLSDDPGAKALVLFLSKRRARHIFRPAGKSYGFPRSPFL